MVVRLGLEDDRQSVTAIDGARVFAGSLQDLGPLGGQLAQQRFRGLVGAVLTPQRAEHPELQVIRVATQGANDGTVLILLEGHGVELGPSHRQRHHTATRARAWMAERRTASPSSPPSTASQARSGCGIMPTTFPRALEIPAIFPSEPFGLAAAVTRPSEVQ